LLDRGFRVVCQLGRQLERDVTVLTLGAVEHGPQDVGSFRDVAEGKLEEDLARASLMSERGAEVVVVAVRAGDGLLEDGRVRGQSAVPVVVDETAQAGVLDQ
jgi:hypothetical protein